MPQQLIYTSAPRGIVAGRSGHCTVARSAAMREALMLQLEKFSCYQHLSLSGGRDRPIFCGRLVDIRGTRFHVLSRIQDAGLDFTGRTNFIAHHLAFTPEEIRLFPTPPVILRDWPGWVKAWTKEPQLLENEDWTALTALAGRTNVPAQAWQRVTGDAVNGFGLLETRAGASFRVDDQPDETVLELIAESLELLEIRDPRRNFRTTAWNYTFTTSMQEQDNPADFRWRCLHSDNPVASRLATPDCRALSAVRATKLTAEETAFARTGRQAPRFVAEPADVRITEGQPVRFTARAEGVPNPAYQWYKCDKDGKEIELLNAETSAELALNDPLYGVTRYRVWATNSLNSAQSRLAVLSVEKKIRLAATKSEVQPQVAAVTAPYQKTEAEIEDHRLRLEASEAESAYNQRHRRRLIFAVSLTVGLLLLAGIVLGVTWVLKKNMAKVSAQMNGQTNAAIAQSLPTASVSTSGPSNSPALGQPPAGSVNEPDHQRRENGPVSVPLPWKWENIGSTNKPVIPLDENGVFSFRGTGKVFFGNTDSFLFTSQVVSNADEFVVRLLRVYGETSRCQCGIMMRESDQPDALFAFLGLSSTNIIWTQRLPSNGDCKSDLVTTAKLPMFLRLRRNEDFFIGEISTDGTNWNYGKTNEMSIAKSNYWVGFAVTAGKPTSEVSADFDNITNHLIEAKP